jgi:hypothetical protein
MAARRWPYGSGPSLINDYTYQVLTDQNERDIARLAEHHRHVRLALSGRVSWWRRLMARREQRINRSLRIQPGRTGSNRPPAFE